MTSLFVAFMCAAVLTHAQHLRTANGTLILEVDGASLTLSGTATNRTNSCSTPSALVSQADLQSAIAASASLTQPQV